MAHAVRLYEAHHRVQATHAVLIITVDRGLTLHMQGCAVMMVVLPNETNTSDQVHIPDDCSSPVNEG